MKRIAVLSVLVVALLIVGALPALAASSSFTGTLTPSNPQYPVGRPDNADCGIVIDDLLPEKYVYRLMNVMVTETGTYSYLDDRGSNPSFIDIEVAVFDGPFDPNSPMTNCITSMDDSVNVNLEAGKVYIFSVTSWDIPTTGPYGFTLTGPGSVYEVTDTSCPYPLPSGAVMSSVPAGAPAFWAPDLSAGTGFNIPAGTWWTFGTDGDFTHLWVACQAEPVWVPSNAVAP